MQLGHFSLFPVELLKYDLKPNELRVLVALYSFRNKEADTVYPELEKLAKRAGISDKTTVSKVTTSLAKKGFLIKRKRGFDKGNDYRLIVPEMDEIEGENTPENDGDSTKLDDSSNLGKVPKSKLDKTSKSKLDDSSKVIEHTNEHKEEHTNKKIDAREPKPPRKRTRFIKPELIDIQSFIAEENLSVDPDYFFDYYESNGWQVGRTKMKDWRATVRNWHRRSFNSKDSGNGGGDAWWQ